MKNNKLNNYDEKLEDIAIKFENVSKTFKNKKALDNISFEVKKGQFHGFIGSNGSGKTTSIRSMLGFYSDVKGKMFINGYKFNSIKTKEKIGYIPEIAIFPKNLNTYEYLYYFACMSNIKPKIAKEKVKQLMQEYNLIGKEFDKSPENLSSGQKKKVLLIQALILEPDLLILDEPAANLDPISRNEFYEALDMFHKKGKTIFISSHILSELEKYVDSYTLIENGKIIESTSLKDKNKTLEFNWKISLIDKSKQNDFLSILNKLNINYQVKNDSILLELKTNEIKNNLLAEIIKNNLSFSSFLENDMKLSDIYFNNTKINTKK